MTNAKTFRTFIAMSDAVVIGTNSENADYSNPRGEIHGFSSYVQASNDFGDTRVLGVRTERWESDAMAPAEKLATDFQHRFDTLGKAPVGFESWIEGRAIYGSDAYQAYGQSDDVEMECCEVIDESFRY